MTTTPHHHHRSVFSALLLPAALLLGACSGATEDQSAPLNRGEVVVKIAEDTIVPSYQRLVDATDTLAIDVSELCSAPNQTSLETARSSWSAAQSAWMLTSAVRIGPQRSPQSAAVEYPIDASKIDIIADDVEGAAITAAAVVELGSDVRGLDAIEYLLFTPPGVDEMGARRCEYAASAARVTADGAAALLAAWVDGTDGEASFLEQISNTGGNSNWQDPTEAIEDLLNASLSTLREVIDAQLGVAIGLTDGKPNPQAVDSGPARQALLDISDELRSVAAVYGDANTKPPTGISALLAGASTTTSDAAIRRALDTAIRSVEMVPPPLVDIQPTDTQSDAMALLTDAYEQSLAVRSALSTEVASLLGLTVRFSDSDGDS